MIILVPLSPREAYEDQLKIKRESGQSSGDGSSKEKLGGLLLVPIMFLSSSKLKRSFPSLSIMIEQRFEVKLFSR